MAFAGGAKPKSTQHRSSGSIAGLGDCNARQEKLSQILTTRRAWSFLELRVRLRMYKLSALDCVDSFF